MPDQRQGERYLAREEVGAVTVVHDQGHQRPAKLPKGSNAGQKEPERPRPKYLDALHGIVGFRGVGFGVEAQGLSSRALIRSLVCV